MLAPLKVEKPRSVDGAFFFGLCINYSGWGGTAVPPDCSGLARGFAIWGLDRKKDDDRSLGWGERTGKGVEIGV